MRETLASFADLAQNDLAQAIEHARALCIELPGTTRCRERMWLVYGLDRQATGHENDGGNDG